MAAPRFLRLGASLYVPAVRDDLAAVMNGRKIRALRSLIVCTEDAIHACDLPRALDRLGAALASLEPSDTLRFVRVRSAAVLASVLAMEGAEHLDGFVLPKITASNLDAYVACLPAGSRHQLMITLETPDVFDGVAMRAMAARLSDDALCARVLSLRVGGNDLLGLLALRRPHGATVYDTPIGRTLSELVMVFRPLGFNLTAPVFDGVDEDGALEREVRMDLAQGLFGKTAIHPSQVGRIEALYKVPERDLRAAERVLASDAPAVFLSSGRMLEPVTQARWAEQTVARAELYGVG